MNENNTNIGTIKMFNNERGFGFVKLDSIEKDVFMHIGAFNPPNFSGDPVEGMKIKVKLGPGRKDPNKAEVKAVLEILDRGAESGCVSVGLAELDLVDEKGIIQVDQFEKQSRGYAKSIKGRFIKGKNVELTRTKLRQYYASFIDIAQIVERAEHMSSEDLDKAWAAAATNLKLLLARAAYDAKRQSPAVSNEFIEFLEAIADMVMSADTTKDKLRNLEVANQFFEAVVGYSYEYVTKN